MNAPPAVACTHCGKPFTTDDLRGTSCRYCGTLLAHHARAAQQVALVNQVLSNAYAQANAYPQPNAYPPMNPYAQPPFPPPILPVPVPLAPARAFALVALIPLVVMAVVLVMGVGIAAFVFLAR